jgi:hemolysin III
VQEHPDPLEKPRLRGVSHAWAFVLSLFSGAALVALARDTDATLVALVYALSVSALLGVSGLYHRVDWQPAARAWMRRLDHTMIFVLIAGSYTPIAVYALDPGSQTWVLATVWGAVGAVFAVNLGLQNAPHWFHAILSVAGGFAGVATFPEIARNAGWGCMTLLIIGGVLYVGGAACYALKRPNPFPGTFGYHEVFHAMVILAAATHYAAIARYVLPLAG